MADLSGESAGSQAGNLTGTNETRPDKEIGENLSACLERTCWSGLPVKMQMEIIKQYFGNGDKPNLLCSCPALLPVISDSYPHNNPNAANEGKGTEAESSPITIKYSSEKKMPCGREMVILLGPKQPHKIFGLRHNRVVLVGLDSKSEHTDILLSALESTSTTTRNLDFDANEFDFPMVLDFVKALKPSSLELNFDNSKKEYTLNEFVEAFPALSELDELAVLGSVRADGDSLLSHFSKFPPSVCFTSTSFLHTGDIARFLGTLVSTKFEKGGPAANALKRIVNWTFETYRTETEEGGTTDDCKLLVELVKGIPPNSIMNLDSATGAVKRRIFELHLTVGGEQHVIYVKEEVNSADKYRPIQLANRIADFCRIQESPASSTISDMDDSDEDDELMDDDH